jgi:putative ABC transport system substrate-binding protein
LHDGRLTDLREFGILHSGQLAGSRMQFDRLKRREFITLFGGAAVAWPLTAHAQQPSPMRRIGVLMPTGEDDAEGRARVAAFLDGLGEVGLTDGRNVKLDFRWGGNDVERLRTLASELVALAPEVLLAGSSPPVVALRRATTTIPIVFVLVSDPVGQGFVESLARPGANVTGFTNFEFSMIGKWVALLKEIAPATKRIGVIFHPETAPYTQRYQRPFEDVARSFATETVIAPVRSEGEIDSTMAALARSEGGVIVMSDPFTAVHRRVIVTLAARYRIPVVYPYRFFTADGGLMSYGADVPDLFRRSASYINRILGGATPRDLPVQQPTKFELVVNLSAAKALGLTVPDTLLARADEVID